MEVFTGMLGSRLGRAELLVYAAAWDFWQLLTLIPRKLFNLWTKLRRLQCGIANQTRIE
jgi:hypothetical protein